MTTPVNLLRDLVAIPSVNPALLPPNDENAGERRIAEFVGHALARDGLAVAFDEIEPGRPNVIARLTPSGKAKRRVILAPHLDTVGEPAMTPSLFTPVVRNKRLHGRGACDTKGSVAAMMTAVQRIAKNGRRPVDTEIVFVGLADEEHRQLGSRRFAAKKWKANLAIVGEPTRLHVVTAHKGLVWLEAATRGKAAHGARPELGRNAVHTMARVVEALATEHAAALESRSHPLLGRPTANIGSIRGGKQPNIVPDKCVISIDRRTLPGETETAVIREFKELFKRRGLKVQIRGLKGVASPSLETDPAQPWVRHFMDAARQQRPVGVDYFCDAAILAESGIPSVVFGPGDIAQAHTADEWIALSSLERGADLLERYLRDLP